MGGAFFSLGIGNRKIKFLAELEIEHRSLSRQLLGHRDMKKKWGATPRFATSVPVRLKLSLEKIRWTP